MIRAVVRKLISSRHSHLSVTCKRSARRLFSTPKNSFFNQPIAHFIRHFSIDGGNPGEIPVNITEISSFQAQNVTKNPVVLPSYNRVTFATPPVFGDNFIVGNLNQIVKPIEGQLLRNLAIGKNYKESVPFFCLINPPRQGKSLLLDRLFVNNDEVLIIGVTYNSTTGFVKGETDDPKTALKWFWIRVLKSMLQISEPLETLSQLLQPDQCSWPHIKSLIISGLSSNPFIDKNGKEKNILFCIDEFSVITDKLQKWDEDKQKQFISKLHRTKQASYPFRQFVMTGFHLDMNRLLAFSSRSNIKRYTLDLCDFSTSRPLLRKIFEAYKAKNIPFPLYLFEIVKSTPGLIGFWAELLRNENLYCLNTSQFTGEMIWLEIITDPGKTGENGGRLKSNWLLIFNYLTRLVDEDPDSLCDIHDVIVAAEIGISVDEKPDLIPLCFVEIISRAYCRKIGDSPLQNIILDELVQLFETIKNISADVKTGDPFELLMLTALHIRLLLWVQLQFGGGENPEQIVQIPFRSLFPIPYSESFSGVVPQLKSTFSVHSIRSKESLSKLLMPPLYNIFPLGVKSLEDKWDDKIDSSLLKLIKSKTADYKLHALESNPMINISSKAPPLMKQTIICKEKNRTVKEDLVLKLFNRMKSGESYEDISQTLTGDDLIWFKRLRTLANQLKLSIDNNHSLIPTADSAESADLLVAWKQLSSDPDDDDTHPEVIHIAALELKDQRQTPLDEWEKKWNILTSPFCILHWMSVFFPDCQFSIHFIFAGREHSD